MSNSSENNKHDFKKRPNVNELRRELRKQYNNRLKSIRETDKNKRRQLIVEKVATDIVRNELKDQFLAENYNSDDIMDAINEIERDIIDVSLAPLAEHHEISEQEVMINTVNTHLVLCNICDRYTILPNSDNTVTICDNCFAQNFKENNLQC